MLQFTDAAPLLTLPWFVAIIVESYILHHGTTPSLFPLPLISSPLPLILSTLIPTPPPDDVSFINSALVNPIPLIESGVSTPKHEIGNPLSVPVLEITGLAKPIHPLQIYLKNLFAKSGLSRRSATAFATLLYAFLGVSPGIKYPLDIVDKATSFIHSG